MNHPTFVDLFAGCGGLSLGLEQAGFFPLFVNELNHDAMATYLANRAHINPLLNDRYHISDVKQMVLRDDYLPNLVKGFRADYAINAKRFGIDLVVGGPPCQGFSGIGHRRSYSVEKKQLPSNHLFQDMAYVVNELRPKAFIFENVKGLLSARWTNSGSKGEIWEEVLATFKGIGGGKYKVGWRLVHASDYDVAQNRPRVIMVGVHRDLAADVRSSDSEDAVEMGLLPPATRKFPNIRDLLGDLIDDEFEYGGVTDRYPHPAKSKIQQYFRTAIDGHRVSRKGSVLTEHDYSKHSKHVIAKFKHMLHNNGEIPAKYRTKKFAQRVLPAVWGAGGPTITATSLPDDYVHFCQPRILTVREWARLQMFPDWYQFSGKKTTGGTRRAGNPREGIFEREVPKYTQIGNAVPVAMARAFGAHLRHLLGWEESEYVGKERRRA